MSNSEDKITEDDFWFVYYGLKELIKKAQEIIDRADIIIKGGDNEKSG